MHIYFCLSGLFLFQVASRVWDEAVIFPVSVALKICSPIGGLLHAARCMPKVLIGNS